MGCSSLSSFFKFIILLTKRKSEITKIIMAYNRNYIRAFYESLFCSQQTLQAFALKADAVVVAQS